MNRRFLVWFLKVGLSVGLLGYLTWSAAQSTVRGSAFQALVESPPAFGPLALAWAILTAATGLTLVRWWLLLRGAGVPCSFLDAAHAGFWAAIVSQTSLGAVSGDVVKGLVVGRKCRGHGPEIAASVLVDRAIGLYVLFAFVAAAGLLSGFWPNADPGLDAVGRGVFLIVGLGAVGIVAMLVPGPGFDRRVISLARIPVVGRTAVGVIHALRHYREVWPTLVLASVLSAGIHAMSAVGVYFVAVSLGGGPTLADHLVIVPLSIAAAVVPLPVGPSEFVLEFLYSHWQSAAGQGVLASLANRLLVIAGAAFGVLAVTLAKGFSRSVEPNPTP